MTTSCSTATSCGCSTENKNKEKKQNVIQLDFLYIDLEVCSRCSRTEINIQDTLEVLQPVLEQTGHKLIFNSIHVQNEKDAIDYQLISSPTLRINGRDIQFDIVESDCQTCGSLVDQKVDCREWQYNGNTYTELPKGLIIDSIMEEIYIPTKKVPINAPYNLPENLKRFFELKKG